MESIQFLPLSILLAIGFAYMPFIGLGKFPSIRNLLTLFLMNLVEFCLMLFLYHHQYQYQYSLTYTVPKKYFYVQKRVSDGCSKTDMIIMHPNENVIFGIWTLLCSIRKLYLTFKKITLLQGKKKDIKVFFLIKILLQQ